MFLVAPYEKRFHITVAMILNNWHSRTFKTLWCHIPKLSRPNLLFKNCRWPRKNCFSKTFKNF